MNPVSLEGKKGLLIGIANEHSIAYGCAKVFRGLGADLAMTYREKSEKWVRPLAEQVKCPIFMPCDVQNTAQLQAVFERIKKEWGRLDFALHSVAFAPKEDLHARVVDCSAAGFTMAMGISSPGGKRALSLDDSNQRGADDRAPHRVPCRVHSVQEQRHFLPTRRFNGELK
jgi:enoyl-[acyl-carrier protein] reductase I